MAESIQHKLDRVRPPRVQITYDVEIGDAIVMKELPFVVGILADLSGMPDKELPERPDPSSRNGKRLPAEGPKEVPPLRERKYVSIDRDNFNDVMKSTGPRLAFTVGALTVEPGEGRLRWGQVAHRAEEGRGGQGGSPPRRRRVQEHGRLQPHQRRHAGRAAAPSLRGPHATADLLTKLEGNEKLDRKLTEEILKATDKAKLEAIKAEAEGGQSNG